ncbi:MAG: cytochrome c [Bradyrhizobium sp.]|nr:cytochrome c [Bradyrhizobium sp.]
MRGKTIAKIVVAALVIGGIYAVKDDIAKLWEDLHVRIAEYPQPKKSVWLEQNVSKERLEWFYHADQGTRTFGVPYEWFIALEQPTIPWLIFTNPGAFRDQTYLDRYGFIPGTTPIADKIVLPIGFARGGSMLDPSGAPWRNPTSKQDMRGIGLTCAACHTGRFTYKDTAVIIDGGPALTDLFKLKKGIGVAVLYARLLPGRFGRFANNVLGENATDEDRDMLKQQMDQVLKQLKTVKNLEEAVAGRSILEGYGRLDALNRIGNQVFSLDLKKPENYEGSSAPVHYPRIWNTPWFDWVQYNGSIMQPMVRNAGESLGVSAELNLTDPSKGLFKSSANIDSLHEMEQMIAGEAPSAAKGFGGLASPRWPEDILPKINWTLAGDGAKLYKEHCQECHRPPVSKFEPPVAGQPRPPATANPDYFNFDDKDEWRTNEAGQQVRIIENIPIEHIGTDAAQATDMMNRTVALPDNLGIKDTAFALALKDVVEKTVNYIYDRKDPPWNDWKRANFNGNMPNIVRGELAYKVRPLNGVWATPPYLHNGSVPTIDALIGPPDKRPKEFYLGHREYDPEKLGYKSDPFPNGFKLDTSIRGNGNTGHEFSKKYIKGKKHQEKGVIGPELSDPDRKAILEYLKTL